MTSTLITTQSRGRNDKRTLGFRLFTPAGNPGRESRACRACRVCPGHAGCAGMTNLFYVIYRLLQKAIPDRLFLLCLQEKFPARDLFCFQNRYAMSLRFLPVHLSANPQVLFAPQSGRPHDSSAAGQCFIFHAAFVSSHFDFMPVDNGGEIGVCSAGANFS